MTGGISTFIAQVPRCRTFRLSLLLFQILWLNVIVPGHRRGAVSVEGGRCEHCAAIADSESGATSNRLAACHRRASHHLPTAPSDGAAHCAICFFAARISPAIAVDYTHPPLRYVALLAPATVLVAHDATLLCTYLGRAPPMA